MPADMTYEEWENRFTVGKTNDKINLREELTDEDRKAINDYISSKSYIVNEKLRNGIPLTKDEETFVNNLDNALDKMPKFEGNLQRSLYFNSDEDVAKFMEKYIIKDFVTYNAYVSTTKGKTYNPEGQVQIYIKDAQNGIDISLYNKMEDEVLYNRGSIFKILNIVKENGKYYILLEEKKYE